MSDMEFSRTVRGVDITVFAANFSYDPSVGIVRFAPDDVWAKTDDGSDFELTEEEEEQLADEAVESMLSGDDK